jgi:hypothetical protein
MEKLKQTNDLCLLSAVVVCHRTPLLHTLEYIREQRMAFETTQKAKI